MAAEASAKDRVLRFRRRPPWAIDIADVNRDGKPDLVVIPYDRDAKTRGEAAKVTLLNGDGSGKCQANPSGLRRENAACSPTDHSPPFGAQEIIIERQVVS